MKRRLASFIPYLLLMFAVLVFYRNVLFDSTYTFPWDFRSVHVPFATFIAESFRQGQWPLWSPYMYAGMPIFANIQAASFYPPMLAATSLSAITNPRVDGFLEWELVFHVFIAGVFTFWLLRHLGTGSIAALTGAIVYSLGGFFAAQAEHLGAVSGAAWLPLAWLSVLHLRNGWSYRWLAVLAVSISMAVLAGLPQVAVALVASSFLLAAALSVTSVPRPSAMKLLVAVAIATIWAALLAAVQLVPTFQLTWNSIAQYRADYMNTGGGVRPESLMTLILPNYLGIFDPAKFTGRGDLTFSYFYCSIAGLVLAIIGVFRRDAVPFSIVTFLSGLWMLGDSTWIGSRAFLLLPASIRIGIHPEFVMCAFLLGVAVLAGLGVERFAKWRRLAWILPAIVTVDLIVTSSGRPMNQVSRVAEPGVSDTHFDGSRELLQGVRKLSWSTTPPSRIDANDRSLIPWAVSSAVTHVPSAYGHDPLALERIIKVRLAFAQGQRWGSNYPIENLGSRVIDLMNVRYVLSRSEIDPQRLRHSNLQLAATLPGHWVYENKTVLPRFFFAPQVRMARNLDEAARMLRAPEFDPHREAIVEGLTPTFAPSPLGTIQLHSYSPSRIELTSESPQAAFLVASEANYPGWKAYVDGVQSPFFYTNVAFRGMAVPAGRHTIVMEFAPDVLWYSLGVSTLAWIALGITIAKNRYQLSH